MEEFREKLHKLIHQCRHNFGGTYQPIVSLVNAILSFAIKIRASDIHIEPVKDIMRVRYRIDGYLREFHEPIPIDIASTFTARIKIMAGMDTTTIFSPLDGALNFEGVEMRVASIPLGGAESLTIRLLDSERELHNLSELGFTPANEKIFRQAIAEMSGMIILTGPMNSGKSTAWTRRRETICSERAARILAGKSSKRCLMR